MGRKKWFMTVVELQLVHPNIHRETHWQAPHIYTLPRIHPSSTLTHARKLAVPMKSFSLYKQLPLILFRSVRNTHWWVHTLGIQSNRPLFIVSAGLLLLLLLFLLSHRVNPLSWWSGRQMERGRHRVCVARSVCKTTGYFYTQARVCFPVTQPTST